MIDDLKYVDHLQRKNAEDLAFYPKACFEREIGNARIVLARYNATPCGYLYHGSFRGPDLKIHQACIQYDLRGQLYGALLVRHVRTLALAAGSCDSISLRCGSDILANGFWAAMGFVCTEVTLGGVRRMRDINHWRLAIKDTALFVASTPSTKAKDASLWRRNKGEKVSQFIRGRGMLDYRAELVAKDKKDMN